MRFYQAVDPSHLGSVTEILGEFAGKEAQMYKALLRLYPDDGDKLVQPSVN